MGERDLSHFARQQVTLTDRDDIVAFLSTLSDGYYTPARRPPPGDPR